MLFFGSTIVTAVGYITHNTIKGLSSSSERSGSTDSERTRELFEFQSAMLQELNIIVVSMESMQSEPIRY